ncbi:MFS general substrate transporter [Backusella circina FSU 941]|nr:MFS general substrate transporter [Backusella circina FSU 941]
MLTTSNITGSTITQGSITDTCTKTDLKRPFLFRYRSSNLFVFWTAAVGLFTSTFVHSILFPLSPFIVARIRNLGKDEISHSQSSSITQNIGVTSRDTGILVALYAVGLLAGSPIFGWLGDKIKQRRLPMLLGTCAAMAANLLFMESTTYSMLLLARFLQGIASSCVWTMCLCLIADNWPREHLGAQMGKLVGFYPLGMMVGLPAGVLYSKLGHQAPFIASIILSGIDLVMRLVVIERSSAPAEWFSPRDEDPTLSMRLAQEWNFGATGCSLIILAYMVPSIISSGVCGWLCDRYGTKIVAIISLFLSIPSCILMGVPSHVHGSFWPLIPILIVGGITIAGCQAPVFPEIAKVVDEANGNSKSCDGLARSYSLFNAAYGIGKQIPLTLNINDSPIPHFLSLCPFYFLKKRYVCRTYNGRFFICKYRLFLVMHHFEHVFLLLHPTRLFFYW